MYMNVSLCDISTNNFFILLTFTHFVYLVYSEGQNKVELSITFQLYVKNWQLLSNYMLKIFPI